MKETMKSRTKLSHINAFERSINGESYKSIGESFGVSGERIRQVIHKIRRKLCHPVRWKGTDEQKRQFGIFELRKDKKFWLDSAKRFRDEINHD